MGGASRRGSADAEVLGWLGAQLRLAAGGGAGSEWVRDAKLGVWRWRLG